MPFLQALSQFYLLLLFPTKVQCINRVNGQVRQELTLTPSRTLSVGPQTAETLALASDDAEGTVYLMAGDLKISDFDQAVAGVPLAVVLPGDQCRIRDECLAKSCCSVSV